MGGESPPRGSRAGGSSATFAGAFLFVASPANEPAHWRRAREPEMSTEMDYRRPVKPDDWTMLSLLRPKT